MVLFFSVIGNPTFVKQWRNRYSKHKELQEYGEIVMSIELQRQYLEEIKKEVENLNRILNNDNDMVRDEILLNTYKALEIQ